MRYTEVTLKFTIKTMHMQNILDMLSAVMRMFFLNNWSFTFNHKENP